jgi:PhzF family phenazine biosynthesis protein
MKTNKYPIYQVDAFATQIFQGNPAAVCPLTQWFDDEILQKIASENNLAETAFFIPSDGSEYDYHLRWFTPVEEVNLCGHATLATAYVIFEELGFKKDLIRFQSLSGILTVAKKDKLLSLNFPEWSLEKIERHEGLSKALNHTPLEIYKSHDWVAVLKTQEDVQNLKPDFQALKNLENCPGIIVTAPSDNDKFDFVSRAFFPKIGIDEDPVTGSAHCALVPYWANRLNKNALKAKQISSRSGELNCELTKDRRIIISGEARLYLEGSYYIPTSI